jgi:hypothetical protein
MKKLSILLLLSFLSCIYCYPDGSNKTLKQITFGDGTVQTTASSGSSGGGSIIAVGTGTASNFTTIITSPTVNFSALGSQFSMTTNGTTSFWALNPSTVTLLGPSIDISGNEITGVLASSNFPSLSGDVSNSGLVITVLNDSHNHTVATSTFGVTGGNLTVTNGDVGIGTNTPVANLHVNGPSGITISTGNVNLVNLKYSTTTAGLLISSATQVNGTLYVVTSSTLASQINNGLIVYGHIEVSSTTPTVSSCGSTPSATIVGTDQGGKVTVGGGTVTSCTITFTVPWVNAPSCYAFGDTQISTGTTTTSAFTFGKNTTFNGAVVMYGCNSYR